MHPKITIITPTARHGGIDVTWLGLSKQTYTDFEWLIVDEIPREKEILSYCNDTRVRWLKSPEKKKGMFWNLDQSGNFALRHAKGDLIVNLQDYIWLPPDALQKLMNTNLMVETFFGKSFCITGVGHKYTVDGLSVQNPVGKITVFHTDIRDVPLLWREYDKDPRMKGGGLHVCNPIEWEANFSMLPRKLLYELGGWDEDFDAGWGYDNVNLAERIVAHGGLCWIDEGNESYSISHENIFGETDFKENAPNNVELWQTKNKAIEAGKEIYLDFLK